MPHLSIGMPVYNGERFLREALDSMLTQDYRDLELIISDNASTDRTQTICEDYAKRDPRVRYVRQATNIGAVRNWNYVVEHARGSLFKWASCNDHIAPGALSACVAYLDQHPETVLCYGRTILIDDAGKELGTYDRDIVATQKEPHERFQHVLQDLKLNNAQCAVIRTDVLKRSRLERAYPSGDMVLMAELAIDGTFVQLPHPYLYRRMDEASSTKFLSPEALRNFLDPSGGTPRGINTWRMDWDYLRVAATASTGFGERLRMTCMAARNAWWDRGKLAREMKSFVRRGSGA